jgi:hypothetical protein
VVGIVGVVFTSTKTASPQKDELYPQTADGHQPQEKQTEPQPQRPQQQPQPQAAEHRKNPRRSTKDKHEKVDPGKKQPPGYKPERKYVQPKDDKKKDREKAPYHRKDRDTKPTEEK